MESYTDCPLTFYINFVLFENDSFYKEFNWRENPDNIRVTQANEDSFELLDTEGFSALMHVRLKGGDGTVLAELTDTDGITFSGIIEPNIIIEIPDETIQTIGPGIYEYDMVVTDADNKKYTLFAGDITIKENVTELP
jgi:hypothetical protein